MMQSQECVSRRDRITPLRYPGGKGRLTGFIREIIVANGLDGIYAEPYAGGAAIALNLLLANDVSRIAINDLSPSIFSFWYSILNYTDEFCRLIVDSPLSVEEWDRQKQVFRLGDAEDRLQLGFATFFLNRTNRSGIMNGGIIGGREQRGPWKIDARFNKGDLVSRVQSIAMKKDRISLTNLDAIEFISIGRKSWPGNTLLYLDPPYYVKGRDLYHHFYVHSDHEAVADVIAALDSWKWIISYDNVGEIRDIYRGYRRMIYNIGYSARSARLGSEVMFFSDDLAVPRLPSSVHVVEHVSDACRLA